MANGLEALRSELGGAEAIKAALVDLEAACGAPFDETWIRKGAAPDPDLTVYVLASGGVIHQITGRRDTERDPGKPDDHVITTDIKYSATRISRSASYTVEIRRDTFREQTTVYRVWRFTGRRNIRARMI